MRTFCSLAVVLVVFSGSRAAAAPVPKDAPLPTIDGSYSLLSLSTPEDRMVANGMGAFGGPGGGFGGGGPVFIGGRRTNSVYMTGPATIGKTEITLEGSGVRTGLIGVGGPVTMEYTLDATKTPMTIDIQNVSLRGKKTKSLGLVEVSGNRLILAVAKEGDERPKSTEEADGVTLYYFQKSPPPPRTEFRIVAMTVGKEAETEKELNKLSQEGFDIVSTTTPTAPDAKSSVTTVHFVLKRTVK
jgi:uncharacterized protein (TIGR03067 family)